MRNCFGRCVSIGILAIDVWIIHWRMHRYILNMLTRNIHWVHINWIRMLQECVFWSMNRIRMMNFELAWVIAVRRAILLCYSFTFWLAHINERALLLLFIYLQLKTQLVFYFTIATLHRRLLLLISGTWSKILLLCSFLLCWVTHSLSCLRFRAWSRLQIWFWVLFCVFNYINWCIFTLDLYHISYLFTPQRFVHPFSRLRLWWWLFRLGAFQQKRLR